MKRAILLFLIFTFLTVSASFAQKTVAGDVKLFQNFYHDATLTNETYIDGGLEFQNWDGGNVFDIGARSGFRIIRNFELNLGWSFRNVSYDGGSNTGLSDMMVGGRYQFKGLFSLATAFAAGGYMTLPFGGEDIGQRLFNFGAFAAMRHSINPGFILTGSLGLDFIDTRSSREASLHLGVGSIIPVNSQLCIVPELNLKSNQDFLNMTGAVDYKLKENMRIRGGMGVGLNNDAPDFSIFASMLFFLQ